MELGLEEEPRVAIRLREGLVDTLRSMCKAAVDNILQVHPVFL